MNKLFGTKQFLVASVLLVFCGLMLLTAARASRVEFYFALLNYLAFMGAVIFANTYHNLLSLINAVAYFLWGAYVLRQLPDISPWGAIVALGNYAFIFVGSQYYRSLRIKAEARVAYNNRRIIEQNAKLRRQDIERDLYLAQEVSNSFRSANDIQTNPNYSTIFFEKRHGILGGDWMAVRHLDEQCSVSVVVDATGKGVAAALVIHAVQSLWAYSITENSFDPETWISDVNRTLYMLGQRTAHTVTMGLVMVSGAKLTYYSAGHVPLYIVAKKDGSDQVSAVPSRVGLVGIAETIRVVPHTIDLDKSQIRAVLTGTGGIFTHGTRASRRHILQLLQLLESSGEKALDQESEPDDKIIFWMRCIA